MPTRYGRTTGGASEIDTRSRWTASAQWWIALPRSRYCSGTCSTDPISAAARRMLVIPGTQRPTSVYR